MLRIGDFARIAGVTVRALRHYEAEGLLAPARVDEATGYRSYGFDQLAAIDRILALRGIMDRADQEQIVRLVGPAARLLVVPRADHSFSQHPDATTAFRQMGAGEYPAGAAAEILAFVARIRDTATGAARPAK